MVKSEPELAASTIAVDCALEKLRHLAMPGIIAGNQYMVPAQVWHMTTRARIRNGYAFTSALCTVS